MVKFHMVFSGRRIMEKNQPSIFFDCQAAWYHRICRPNQTHFWTHQVCFLLGQIVPDHKDQPRSVKNLARIGLSEFAG